MWVVVWLNEERKRLDYVTGFKTEEAAQEYVDKGNFLPWEYVTIINAQ